MVGLLLGATAAQATPGREDPAPLGEVTFEVVGLRNQRGVVQAALFRWPDGFPDGRRAFRFMRLPILERSVRATFMALPPGDYAIAVIHDEDADGELDTNWLGIPTEGYGASQNDLPTFSAPKWKDNRFEVVAGQAERIVMRLRY